MASSASTPATFTQLLEFFRSNTDSLSQTPEADDVTDIANGCHENFIATYGDDTDTDPNATVMRTMVHLAPIVGMNETFTAATELEKEHRILTASDFSLTVAPRGSNAASLSVDPL